MRLSSLSFPFATVGTLMIVAACGPNQKRATINPPGPVATSAYVQAVTQCRDSLRPSLAVSVGTAQQKLSVTTCQTVIGTDGKPTRQLLSTPVSYRISKKDSAAQASDDQDGDSEPVTPDFALNPVVATVSISVGLDVSASLSNAEQSEFASRMTLECGRATAHMFEKSSLKAFGRLTFSPQISFVKSCKLADKIQKFDQVLSLKPIKVGNDAGYILSDAPATTNEIFLPEGQNANTEFCAAFARKVSSWLGLSDLATETLKCGAPKDVAAKIANPKKQVSTFVSAQAKGTDYLSDAALNEQDLLTILAPACPTIKVLSR